MEIDTHGDKGKKWIGFDLDGTLAEYNGWEGIEHIGKPIKPIVEAAQSIADGKRDNAAKALIEFLEQE